jgi:hypothetical protein
LFAEMLPVVPSGADARHLSPAASADIRRPADIFVRIRRPPVLRFRPRFSGKRLFFIIDIDVRAERPPTTRVYISSAALPPLALC